MSCSVAEITLDLIFFFFFNDTATTEIYTLSLHDALPICRGSPARTAPSRLRARARRRRRGGPRSRRPCAPCGRDRKSTRLNSSHDQISYAVFCLKKKNKNRHTDVTRGLTRARMSDLVFCR